MFFPYKMSDSLNDDFMRGYEEGFKVAKFAAEKEARLAIRSIFPKSTVTISSKLIKPKKYARRNQRAKKPRIHS